ncbi:hypothetical protein D3C75_549850 [compost metagenome]
MLLHGADLHTGGVGTQHQIGIEVEGIVIGTRRVMSRNIQRIEVVEAIFNLGTALDLETHLAKQALDAFNGAGHRVQATVLDAATRQADVDGLGGQLLVQHGNFEGVTTRVQGILNQLLGLVDHGACGGTLLRRKGAQALHLLGEKALFTQIFDPDFVEGGDVAYALNFGLGLADYFFKLLHVFLVTTPETGACRLNKVKRGIIQKKPLR